MKNTKKEINNQMTKENFIDNFIVTFLANWVAVHYDDYCMMAKHECLSKPPVEDAFFLAEEAWARVEEYKTS